MDLPNGGAGDRREPIRSGRGGGRRSVAGAAPGSDYRRGAADRGRRPPLVDWAADGDDPAQRTDPGDEEGQTEQDVPERSGRVGLEENGGVGQAEGPWLPLLPATKTTGASPRWNCSAAFVGIASSGPLKTKRASLAAGSSVNGGKSQGARVAGYASARSD